MESLIYTREDPQLWKKLSKWEAPKSVFVTPTDTVYGFGCSIHNFEGRNRILQLKKQQHRPFIILVRGFDEVEELAEVTDRQKKILRHYWPGPITFILNSKSFHEDTIALRMPSDLFLNDLLEWVGSPVLSTSCNRHGETPSKSVKEASEVFGSDIDFYVDGGTAGEKASSTIVDLTREPGEVLREGPIQFQEI